MAKLKHLIKNRNVITNETECHCTFCGEHTTAGGLWNDYKADNVIVCNDCSGKLVDLLIDTLRDTIDFENLGSYEQIELLKSICTYRLLRKQAMERNIKTVAKRI